MFRNLYPNEIEVRVQQCKQNGCSLLLYKDARCDMAILDETVGAFNWKREHTRDNKNCIVSVWDEIKLQWVSKEDTGTESNTEQAKGLASDSFKRACFNWGIGRELYTGGFIWVKLDPNEVKSSNNRFNLNYGVKFHVADIATDHNKRIVFMTIADSTGKIRFTKGEQPSIKWKINEQLKSISSDARNSYIEKIKSGELEANEELLTTLQGFK